MSARYEITVRENGRIEIDNIPIKARPATVLHDAIRQQSADIAELRAELAAALDLLDTIFAAYEDGVPCYQDPDEISEYLGNAVILDDDTFHRTANLLNQSKPRKDGG